MPSNEERGYVVRKLIRRCAMLVKEIGISQPFLYKLVPSVAGVMTEPYPELIKKSEDIAQIVKREEEAFEKNLREEIPVLEEKVRAVLESDKDEKSKSEELGKIAFEAYDTSGVPFMVTESLAMESSLLKPSIIIFNNLMDEQKNRSKAASSMVGDVFSGSALKLDVKETEFVGYQIYNIAAKIIKIIQGAKELSEIKAGEAAMVILDKTPFYPEGGGQVGDTGRIIKDGASLEVLDTKKIEKVIVHLAHIKEGSFKTGDHIQAIIDIERRMAIARNHTTTHILQSVLRKVLGEHVQQQGSLVAAEKLRFDFTHFKDISDEQLERIEGLVNENIRQNDCLTHKDTSLKDAKEKGALAFFAEKYEDKVKVVSIANYSAELCGGTHLNSTGQVGLFKITSESAIAQGIRRIEAVTGQAAYDFMNKKEELIKELAGNLKVPEDKIISQVQKLSAQVKDLSKKLAESKLAAFRNSLSQIISEAPEIKGIKVVTQKFSDCDFDFLRIAMDSLKAKLKSGAVVLGSSQEGKAFLVVGLSDDLVKNKWDAAEVIKDIAKVVGGTGGGRPQLAQAGGNIPEKLDEALKGAAGIISRKYGK